MLCAWLHCCHRFSHPGNRIVPVLRAAYARHHGLAAGAVALAGGIVLLVIPIRRASS